MPTTVSITLLLILLQAGFWFIFAILVAFGLIPSIPTAGGIRWIMAVLAVGVALSLMITVFFLRRRNRWAFYFATAGLAAIAALSITDQVGLIDWLSLLASLVPLVLLIKDHAWYRAFNKTPAKK